jgi:hypothetical protein
MIMTHSSWLSLSLSLCSCILGSPLLLVLRLMLCSSRIFTGSMWCLQGSYSHRRELWIVMEYCGGGRWAWAWAVQHAALLLNMPCCSYGSAGVC